MQEASDEPQTRFIAAAFLENAKRMLWNGKSFWKQPKLKD
jgi:hypothetical protein